MLWFLGFHEKSIISADCKTESVSIVPASYKEYGSETWKLALVQLSLRRDIVTCCIGSVATGLSNYLGWIPMCVLCQHSALMLPNYSPDKTRPIMMLVSSAVCVCVCAHSCLWWHNSPLAHLESVVCGWTAQSISGLWSSSFMRTSPPASILHWSSLYAPTHNHLSSQNNGHKLYLVSRMIFFPTYPWRLWYLEIWFLH